MENYTESTYGETIADQYDVMYPDVDGAMIDRLHELSEGGKALELGIGTGRVSIPLIKRGVDVYGIDSSHAMVEKLRCKPIGENIPVKIGTFADFKMKDKFDLAFVVFNTFYGLLTQEDQVSCFHSVERVLKPGGKFLIEAFVPDIGRFDRGQTIRAIEHSDNEVGLECSRHNAVTQTVTSKIVNIEETGIKLYPIKIRYAYPSEIDLMAQSAGLKLLNRWGGWHKERFTGSSNFHVSIYGR